MRLWAVVLAGVLALLSGGLASAGKGNGRAVGKAAADASGALVTTIHTATTAITAGAGMETPEQVTCPNGTMVGGGDEIWRGNAPNSPPFWFDQNNILEPINGSESGGMTPSDGSGNQSANGATNPSSWLAYGRFAGQNELGDNVTAYVSCVAGLSASTQIVSAQVAGPDNAGTTAEVTAVCPGGTRLVGGGAYATQPNPSHKPIGSFPSDASGAPAANGTTDPVAWSAVAQAGGQVSSGALTTAYAVCLSDTALHVEVARTDVIDHPAGPGNTNPGSDPVAVVTATCPGDTTLLSGGLLPMGNTTGQDPFVFGPAQDPQQGVHTRGAFPTDSSGNPVSDGSTSATSWTAIIQSGGQATPGTDSHAWAMCAVNTVQASPEVAGGAYYSLALKGDGTVWAWGDNSHGQLGNGTTTSSSTPARITTLSGVTAIAAGARHALAVAGGDVYSWGDDNPKTPTLMSGLSGVTAVAAGVGHSLALESGGTVWGWGLDSNGQLGNGAYGYDNTPVEAAGLSNVRAIAAGDYFSLALEADGTVWAWGDDSHGQLGNGSTSGSNTPVRVGTLGNVLAIAAGSRHGLALEADGTVWGWGENGNNELGTSHAGEIVTTPVQANISGVTAIAAGGYHSLAVKQDGTVWAWGFDSSGQLGTAPGGAPGPAQMSGVSGATGIAGGLLHSLVLEAGGTVWATGDNIFGDLGDGTTTNRRTPVQTNI